MGTARLKRRTQRDLFGFSWSLSLGPKWAQNKDQLDCFAFSPGTDSQKVTKGLQAESTRRSREREDQGGSPVFGPGKKVLSGFLFPWGKGGPPSAKKQC